MHIVFDELRGGIDFVGYPGSELSHRFEFLRLQKLIPQQLALRNIFPHAFMADYRTVLRDGAHTDGHPDLAAIFAKHLAFKVFYFPDHVHRRHKLVAASEIDLILGGGESAGRDHLLPRIVPENTSHGRVHIQKSAVWRKLENADYGVVENAPILPLCLAKCILDFLALADVASDTRDTCHLAFALAERHLRGQNMNIVSLAVCGLFFEIEQHLPGTYECL